MNHSAHHGAITSLNCLKVADHAHPCGPRHKYIHVITPLTYIPVLRGINTSMYKKAAQKLGGI